MVKEFYIIGNGQKVKGEYFCNIVKKYNNSPKGKATRAKYVAKNKEKMSKYNKQYQKNRRNESRRLGLCQICNKEKVREENGIKKTLCLKCWIKISLKF